MHSRFYASDGSVSVWLVGLPSLRRRLAMPHHEALATRITSPMRFNPRADHDDFRAMIDHAMHSAGANARLLSDHALELLWRASRGITRSASLLL